MAHCAFPFLLIQIENMFKDLIFYYSFLLYGNYGDCQSGCVWSRNDYENGTDSSIKSAKELPFIPFSGCPIPRLKNCIN